MHFVVLPFVALVLALTSTGDCIPSNLECPATNYSQEYLTANYPVHAVFFDYDWLLQCKFYTDRTGDLDLEYGGSLSILQKSSGNHGYFQHENMIWANGQWQPYQNIIGYRVDDVQDGPKETCAKQEGDPVYSPDNVYNPVQEKGANFFAAYYMIRNPELGPVYNIRMVEGFFMDMVNRDTGFSGFLFVDPETTDLQMVFGCRYTRQQKNSLDHLIAAKPIALSGKMVDLGKMTVPHEAIEWAA